MSHRIVQEAPKETPVYMQKHGREKGQMEEGLFLLGGSRLLSLSGGLSLVSVGRLSVNIDGFRLVGFGGLVANERITNRGPSDGAHSGPHHVRDETTASVLLLLRGSLVSSLRGGLIGGRSILSRCRILGRGGILSRSGLSGRLRSRLSHGRTTRYRVRYRGRRTLHLRGSRTRKGRLGTFDPCGFSTGGDSKERGGGEKNELGLIHVEVISVVEKRIELLYGTYFNVLPIEILSYNSKISKRSLNYVYERA